MAKTSGNPYDHAAAMVQRFDPDRHVAGLFAPAEARAHLAALYAFALEIGGVRGQVKEALPGEMRLQWWRDVINGERAGEAAANPVSTVILKTMEMNRLPRQPFLDLIDARVADLYDDAPQDWNALEGYCGETQSSLFRLASIILMKGEEPGAAEAAGHAGVAWALTGLLRALPWHARRGQVYFPQTLMDAVGLDREDLVSGRETESLHVALAEMRTRARDHLAKAEVLKSTIRPEIMPAFLPLVMVPRYLAPMETRKYKPFGTIIDSAHLYRVWLMWRGW